jgi:hypothetical protein
MSYRFPWSFRIDIPFSYCNGVRNSRVANKLVGFNVCYIALANVLAHPGNRSTYLYAGVENLFGNAEPNLVRIIEVDPDRETAGAVF